MYNFVADILDFKLGCFFKITEVEKYQDSGTKII